MKINLKSLFVKLIYYCSILMIFFGMLKVSNAFINIKYINMNYLYNVFRVLCTFLCMFYVLFLYKSKKIAIIKFLSIFLIYEIIITIFTFSFGFPSEFVDLFLWPLLVFVFYDYTKTHDNLLFIKKNVSIVYIITIVISIYLVSLHLSGKGNAGYVIFPTYFSLSLLPLTLKFADEKKGKYFIAMSILISLFSEKRTGFLIAIIGGIVYMLSLIKLKDSTNKRIKGSIKLIIYALVIIGIVYTFAGDQISEILLRYSRLSIDRGSGRENIWNTVLLAFNNSNTIQKVFGHGNHSVINSLMPGGITRYAHNSFIEYLYDYGIIGAVLLINFITMLLYKAYNYRKIRNKNYSYLMYIIIISLFLSMFSYYFEQSYIIVPISIILGIIFGEESKGMGTNES